MCRVGGLPTYRTQNTSNTTYHWCVVLEVYRHTQHKIPPTRHTIGVSCWMFIDIHNTNKIPPTRYTIGVSCWRFTNIHNTKYLQHDIPLVCRVEGLLTYTTQNTSNMTYHWCVVLEVYRHTPTQNTSNTTYHWCVVYVVTFRPSYKCLHCHKWHGVVSSTAQAARCAVVVRLPHIPGI